MLLKINIIFQNSTLPIKSVKNELVKKLILILFLPILLAGCVTAPEPLTKKNSELTQGMVQMNLEVGKTTKADVVENLLDQELDKHEFIDNLNFHLNEHRSVL